MRLLGILLLAFGSVDLAADRVHLSIACGDCEPGEVGAIAVSLRRLEPAHKNTPAKRTELSLPQGTELDLEPGWWSAEVDHPSLWQRPHFFRVAGDTDSQIEAWRTGVVSGRALFIDQRDLPTEIHLRFGSEGDPAVSPSGEITCPIAAGGTFTCRVPVGTFDFRLRASRCIAHYKWARSVSATSPADLGEMTFVQGATLGGRVILARGVESTLDRLRVVAAPSGTSSLDAEKSNSSRQLTAAVDRKGNFHFAGLAPGDYVIRAIGKELTSPPIEVHVRANTIGELNEALLVGPLQKIRVFVLPPLDPQGHRWKVQVSREIGSFERREVASAHVSADGSWESTPLHAGRYSIEVAPQLGGSWRTDVVDVAADPIDLQWTLFARPVSGSVTLRDEPVRAKVTLRSKDVVVELRSNDEGKIEGHVPTAPSPQWIVTVDCENPRAKRAFHIPDSEITELKLSLSGGVLQGKVIQPGGSPAAGSLVSVRAASLDPDVPVIQTKAAADGSFSVIGVEPGAYLIYAADFLKQSESRDVLLKDGTTADPVTLELLEDQKVPGIVFSDHGPVGGASVVLLATDVIGAGTPYEFTDREGRFYATVGGTAREIDVFVAPPGFAYRMIHTSMRSGGLRLKVNQESGTLQIIFKPDRERKPVVKHAGASMGAYNIAHFWPGSREEHNADGRVSITLPSMEPGVYRVCMQRSGRDAEPTNCSDVFLAPYGAVIADLTRSAGSAVRSATRSGMQKW